MIDKLLDPNERPQYAPDMLCIRFIDGLSFEQMKQFLEKLGFCVPEKTFSWDRRSTILVSIPSGNVEQWIIRLQSEAIIRRVEKVRISYT